MAHECSTYWGKDAVSLTTALANQTFAEWKLWKGLQAKKTVKQDDPFEGWVHRASDRADYEALALLYHELLLALKQPSDAPNKWDASSFQAVLPKVPSAPYGTAARAVLKGLEEDGKAQENGKPSHHEEGVARYGTPNWLEKPVKGAKGREKVLGQARDLLRALRDAFAR